MNEISKKLSLPLERGVLNDYCVGRMYWINDDPKDLCFNPKSNLLINCFPGTGDELLKLGPEIYIGRCSGAPSDMVRFTGKKYLSPSVITKDLIKFLINEGFSESKLRGKYPPSSWEEREAQEESFEEFRYDQLGCFLTGIMRDSAFIFYKEKGEFWIHYVPPVNQYAIRIALDREFRDVFANYLYRYRESLKQVEITSTFKDIKRDYLKKVKN